MENEEAMERIRHALRVPVGAHVCELAYAAERLRSEHAELQRGVRTMSNTSVEDADAIIHALVDERVALRSKADWYQLEAIELASRIPADDPRGATDEDPLTDVERSVVDALREGARSFDELAAALSVDSTKYLSRSWRGLWDSLQELQRRGHITSFDPTPQPEELPELWKLSDKEAAQ